MVNGKQVFQFPVFFPAFLFPVSFLPSFFWAMSIHWYSGCREKNNPINIIDIEWYTCKWLDWNWTSTKISNILFNFSFVRFVLWSKLTAIDNCKSYYVVHCEWIIDARNGRQPQMSTPNFTWGNEWNQILENKKKKNAREMNDEMTIVILCE